MLAGKQEVRTIHSINDLFVNTLGLFEPSDGKIQRRLCILQTLTII
jgi:hypothetical protein